MEFPSALEASIPPREPPIIRMVVVVVAVVVETDETVEELDFNDFLLEIVQSATFIFIFPTNPSKRGRIYERRHSIQREKGKFISKIQSMTKVHFQSQIPS